MELGRRGEVVFDRVAESHDLGVLEAGDQRDDRLLNVARQAGRDAVAVVFERVSPLGLEEDLVRRRGRRSGRPCPRSTDSSAGRCSGSVRSTSGARCRLARIRSWTAGIGVGDVAVELRLGRSRRSGTRTATGSASPGWGSSRAKSMVRPLSRGGVPVLNRASSNPERRAGFPTVRPRPRRRRGRPAS